MPGKPALTPKQRAAIIADWGSGMPIPAIAKKFSRLPPAIYKIIKPLRNADILPERIAIKLEWKEELKDLGISAVRAGLICNDDPYKQADIGVKTLKGLGEFQPDDTTTINLLQGTPRDWRDRFIAAPAEPVKALPETTTDKPPAD